MGRNAGSLFRGLDYHVNFLRDMQEGVRELLAEEGLTLLPGSFVVLSSQGVCYWIISTDGVFCYQVGGKQVVKQFNSFTDLVFDATAHNGLPT